MFGWNKAMRAIDELALDAFPGLHTISITKVLFGYEAIDLEVFKRWLLKRQKHNVGLRKLTLSRCSYIDEPEIQTLRRLVDDVDWDGYISEQDFIGILRLEPNVVSPVDRF